MALYPFILVKHRSDLNNPVLINHERIHHQQQLELLILPFYLWYLLNYLFNRLKYRDHYQAYRRISFEKEAYAYEEDLSYLSKRKPWAFLKFHSTNTD
jgi:hypothetical protein